jgi:small basic protein (TIGR04137 family)
LTSGLPPRTCPRSIWAEAAGAVRFRHPEKTTMSMHSSLKAASRIAVRRNVLKRFERIDLLKKKGKWKDGDRAFGLPKTKSG